MILNLSQLRQDYKDVYKRNWDIALKLEFLIEVTKVELRYELSRFMAAKRVELSELLVSKKITLRTLQRWKKSYRDGSMYGLMRKRRGSPVRIELSDQVKSLIKNYRSNYRWGSEVIQAHLRLDHDLKVSRYKVERYLGESGLRKQYPCTTKKKVKAKKKRHTKKVVVNNPGEHTQMDVKYQLHLLTDRSKAYVFNFIDHASNWSYKKAYSAIKSTNTEDFMKEVIKMAPFKIKRIQTDNGIEFTYKWTSKNPDDPKEHPLFRLCFKEDIVHKLIPPGEKELQGLVERSHRQDDQELFSRLSVFNLKEFNEELKDYYKWRNRSRRFKKLDWKTPEQWLSSYQESKNFLEIDEEMTEKLVA